MTAESFLERLWGSKPSDLFILIWTLQDKRSRWFRSHREAAAFIASCREMDAYVGVGLSPADLGPHQRCPAEQVAGITALWADLDVASDAHAKRALPPTLEDALSIIPADMAPTITVSTGHGAHAWWLLKEPFVFENGADRDRAAEAVFRWQTKLRFEAANRGWAFDRLADLPRVLRIPGTFNYKLPDDPRPVSVWKESDRRYNLSDFEEYLDALAIPGRDAEQRSLWSVAESPRERSLVVDLNARIPEELIRQWAQTDLRFRNTWFRQRHDLKDQSQSGYDLALAVFGFDAGLSAQRIVDLIIHHRALHNQKQRTRADYFERTLTRASDRSQSAASEAAALFTGAPPAPGPSSAAPDTSIDAQASEPAMPADPLAAKAVLCERISAALGIRILRIVKITGKEPTYQLELEQGRIEIPNVSGLIEQRSLRVAIASAVNKIIPKIKTPVWEKLAQAMLDALIEREGGVEAEFEGAMRVHLGQYLTETSFIPGIEGQPSHAIRRPMVINGQIAVNAVDLQLYLSKTFGQSLSVKGIASMLSAIGAQSIRVRGAKIREQGRWLLPLSQFDPTEFTTQANIPGVEEESYAATE